MKIDMVGTVAAKKKMGAKKAIEQVMSAIFFVCGILSILCVAVIICFTLLYPRIFAITFDETFARATGAKAGAYNTLLAVLTAVTVVLGMRMMGALLISSLIIFPPLAAMRVFRSFRSVTICSAVFSVVCFIVGMTASYALETPSGASVVCVNIIAFGMFAAAGKLLHRG